MHYPERKFPCTTCGAVVGSPCMPEHGRKSLPISHKARHNKYNRDRRGPLDDK